MKMSCRRIITQSSGQDQTIWRFSSASAGAKTWFSLWKSLLTIVWTRLFGKGAKRSDASGMSGSSCRFSPPKAGVCQRTYHCRCLPRAFETACGPLGQDDISWWEIHIAADSALAYTAKTAQWLLAEFWTPAAWSPYLLNLNLLDFSVRRVLQVKVHTVL
jgi:hypothetical protein